MVKNRYLLSVIFLVIIINISYSKDTNREMFTKANQYYRKGNYEKAVQLYEGMILNGNYNDIFCYNLGNAYFKLGKLAKARLWYERALLLNPDNSDVKYNLNIVLKNIKDEIKVSNDFSHAIERIYQYISMRSLVIIFLFFWHILFILIGIELYKGIKFRKLLVSYVILLVLLSFSFGNILIKNELLKRNYAIVMVDETTVRNGPGEKYTAAFSLHLGAKVRIKNSEKDWVGISLDNGLSGWIPKKAIEKI